MIAFAQCDHLRRYQIFINLILWEYLPLARILAVKMHSTRQWHWGWLQKLKRWLYAGGVCSNEQRHIMFTCYQSGHVSLYANRQLIFPHTLSVSSYSPLTRYQSAHILPSHAISQVIFSFTRYQSAHILPSHAISQHRSNSAGISPAAQR